MGCSSFITRPQPLNIPARQRQRTTQTTQPPRNNAFIPPSANGAETQNIARQSHKASTDSSEPSHSRNGLKLSPKQNSPSSTGRQYVFRETTSNRTSTQPTAHKTTGTSKKRKRAYRGPRNLPLKNLVHEHLQSILPSIKLEDVTMSDRYSVDCGYQWRTNRGYKLPLEARVGRPIWKKALCNYTVEEQENLELALRKGWVWAETVDGWDSSKDEIEGSSCKESLEESDGVDEDEDEKVVKAASNTKTRPKRRRNQPTWRSHAVKTRTILHQYLQPLVPGIILAEVTVATSLAAEAGYKWCLREEYEWPLDYRPSGRPYQKTLSKFTVQDCDDLQLALKKGWVWAEAIDTKKASEERDSCEDDNEDYSDEDGEGIGNKFTRVTTATTPSTQSAAGAMRAKARQLAVRESSPTLSSNAPEKSYRIPALHQNDYEQVRLRGIATKTLLLEHLSQALPQLNLTLDDVTLCPTPAQGYDWVFDGYQVPRQPSSGYHKGILAFKKEEIMKMKKALERGGIKAIARE
ncbi:hypothetical protein BJ508DRAFT_315465 [Ascobolus immersus RN42]|uniref:Uncharacterized protein n=1 Tax=Ascobolus immersus RN42 TaxID=1160509 RepID=A0A3N4HGX0_ASCIM|nr:hypothetical protein BJ508DRAFT_315465 [Ascobolus immersus RN42]